MYMYAAIALYVIRDTVYIHLHLGIIYICILMYIKTKNYKSTQCTNRCCCILLCIAVSKYILAFMQVSICNLFFIVHTHITTLKYSSSLIQSKCSLLVPIKASKSPTLPFPQRTPLPLREILSRYRFVISVLCIILSVPEFLTTKETC